LDPLLYRGGYDRRDERGGSGYDRKDYGRRDDRGYDRNERLHTEIFVDLVFIFACLKVTPFCSVREPEPRAEEPKLNCLPEPKLRLRQQLQIWLLSIYQRLEEILLKKKIMVDEVF
jgi:hypothetical protein